MVPFVVVVVAGRGWEVGERNVLGLRWRSIVISRGTLSRLGVRDLMLVQYSFWALVGIGIV